MIAQLRRKLSYANVMATIAMFLALGGGSFALASHLVVNSSDIVNGGVRQADIAAKAVNSSKVADGSLTGADIKEASLNKVPRAAKVDTLTTKRLTLPEGDVSEQVLFERGDWRVTATCSDAADSAFPIGQVMVHYLNADDSARATVLSVDRSAVVLGGGGGSSSRADLLTSSDLASGGTFFASDDSSGIRGLVGIRIPTRDGAYAGSSQCQFDLVVLR